MADQAGDQWTGSVFDGMGYDPTVADWGVSKDVGERMLADGIDKTDGVASFASVRTPAWHKLGVTLDHPASAEELLLAANADYEILMIEDAGVVRDAAGNPTEILTDADKRKTARRNPVTDQLQILGTVSPTYQRFNNRQSFLGFGDALLDLGQPTAATCGVLYGGKQAFMCWKLPLEVLVGGQDAIEWWMLVHTSHDGSRPLTAAITPLRTVCQNTVRYNIANCITRFTIKHTANAKLAVQDARTALQLTYRYQEEFEDLADKLADTSLTTQRFEAIIAKEWGPGEDPSKKKLDAWEAQKDKLVGLFAVAGTNDNIRGTAWAGVQAVSEYVDWTTDVKTKRWSVDGVTDTTGDGYRFWRSLDGEKTVTAAKTTIVRALREYAGV